LRDVAPRDPPTAPLLDRLALAWGLVNAFLGPIARLISLPITVLTFGLFALVVNGALFGITAWLVDALSVDNFVWAILGALMVPVVNLWLNWAGGAAVTPSRS